MVTPKWTIVKSQWKLTDKRFFFFSWAKFISLGVPQEEWGTVSVSECWLPAGCHRRAIPTRRHGTYREHISPSESSFHWRITHIGVSPGNSKPRDFVSESRNKLLNEPIKAAGLDKVGLRVPGFDSWVRLPRREKEQQTLSAARFFMKFRSPCKISHLLTPDSSRECCQNWCVIRTRRDIKTRVASYELLLWCVVRLELFPGFKYFVNDLEEKCWRYWDAAE